MVDVDTNRLKFEAQEEEDAYGAPTNFLEIDVKDPLTHGFGRNRYTDYEVSLRTSLPIFKNKIFTCRRRYSDFEWLKAEVERESNLLVPELPSKGYKRQLMQRFTDNDGIFEDEFIEKRRLALDAFINKLAGHPLAQNLNCIQMFLQNETINKNYTPGRVKR